ncbi:MAG: MFS transporter [Chloroflexi bacterium]|nr:MFS transporter [Chloroflexota bacterium]
MQRQLILAIYAPTLILAFCSGLLLPVLPIFVRDEFVNSYGIIGLVVAAGAIGMIIGDVPAGALVGRLGLKRSMLIGIAGMALGTLAFTWASSVYELILYAVSVGFASTLWNISRHAYLAEAAPSTQRGRAIAIFGGINRLGSFVGPVVGGALGGTFGLRAPFFLYALLALLALIFPAWFLMESSQRAPKRGGVRGHTGHLWQVLRENYRVLLTAGSGQLFAQMIRSGRGIVVPLFAADVLGLDVTQIGLIVGLSSAVDMVMFYPAGYVMDRFGRKFAYVPSFAIQALGMALIPFTGSFLTLLLATSLIGFGNGLGSGTMMTLGADLAPDDARSEFLGLWRLIGDGGASGGPIVVGWVAGLLGLSLATFVIAGIGLTAALALGTLVPETLRRPPPPTAAIGD